MFSDTSTWQKVNFPRDAKHRFENIAPIIVHVVFKANSFLMCYYNSASNVDAFRTILLL